MHHQSQDRADSGLSSQAGMAHDAQVTDPVRRARSPLPLRLVLVAGLCTLLAAPVVAALAASPDPSAPTGPAQPAASEHPGKGEHFEGVGSFGKGDRDGGGRGDVSITAVSGSKVSLTTEDGWTRTITVTTTTEITKAGATITVADLDVGDKISFRQTKNADDTYTITKITVRTPKAGGEVTAVTGSSVTVTSRDGTKTTITVNGSTTYRLGKDAGSKADIAVGSRIAAEGTVSGTTFTASRITIQPSVAGGQVTAKTSTTITVKGRGDKLTTIHVDAGTTYKVRGKDAATLADIAVGDVVIATGALRADGSLDATQVGAGKFKWGNHDKPQAPAASATP
jgi:hypothetical protein